MRKGCSPARQAGERVYFLSIGKDILHELQIYPAPLASPRLLLYNIKHENAFCQFLAGFSDTDGFSVRHSQNFVQKLENQETKNQCFSVCFFKIRADPNPVQIRTQRGSDAVSLRLSHFGNEYGKVEKAGKVPSEEARRAAIHKKTARKPIRKRSRAYGGKQGEQQGDRQGEK